MPLATTLQQTIQGHSNIHNLESLLQYFYKLELDNANKHIFKQTPTAKYKLIIKVIRQGRLVTTTEVSALSHVVLIKTLNFSLSRW
jgi:hypothetical protein